MIVRFFREKVKEKLMKVKELIEELNKFDPELDVFIHVLENNNSGEEVVSVIKDAYEGSEVVYISPLPLWVPNQEQIEYKKNNFCAKK